MLLQWFIKNDGQKILQFSWDEGYTWFDVPIKFDKNELRDRIRELEADYTALIEARK